MYATAAGMLEEFGANLLSRLATPLPGAAVSATLLELTINSGDRTSYTDAEIAAADAAAVVLAEVIGEAEQVMNGYLGQRYTLPLAQATIDGNPIASHCERVALYLLHRNTNRPESVKDDYKDAMGWLKDLATGKARLLEPDNAGNSTATSAAFTYGTGGSTTDSLGLDKF